MGTDETGRRIFGLATGYDCLLDGIVLFNVFTTKMNKLKAEDTTLQERIDQIIYKVWEKRAELFHGYKYKYKKKP